MASDHAAPNSGAPTALQAAMEMLWNDQSPEEKGHYLKVAERSHAAAPAQQARAPLPLAPSEAVAWMNPKQKFVTHAFIWGKDDRQPEYSEPVFRHSQTQEAAARMLLDMTATGRKRINAAADALSEVMAFVKLGDDLAPKVSSALSGLRAMQDNAPQADAALKKACDLLSMTVGTLMSNRQKIGYVDNSPIAKLATEVVEFLRPWPERMPQADAAEPVLLSQWEQKAVLADPMGLECLINYHDAQEAGADAVEHGAGRAHARRALELLAIGRAIIEEDPGLWDFAQKAPFKLRHSERAAQASGAHGEQA